MQLPAPTIKTDSFAHVIKVYLDSPDFKELADATRRGYERYLGIVRDKWGSLEIKGLQPRHVLALRDHFQATPATANAIVRTLSALIVWAIPRGHRPDNPCDHIKKLKTGDGWGPWPWEMIELVEKHAPRWMWHAAALALYTGQRESDVLSMTWTQARGGLIELRQQKTGRQLVIPAHQRLLAVLATIPRQTVQILCKLPPRALDAGGIPFKLASKPQGSAGADPGRWLRLPRLAQVGGRDLAGGGLHGCRDGSYHRAVSADDRALQPAGEPEEACCCRDPQVGTVTERRFVKRIVKLPLDETE